MVSRVCWQYSLLSRIVGIANFLVFPASSRRPGGDALDGHTRDDLYYVTSHGSATQVSEAQ